MKKIISALMVTFIVTYQLQAQIEVYSNNKVGIGTTGTVNSMLSVNTTGNSLYSASIYNGSTAGGSAGLYVSKAIPGSIGYWGFGTASYISAGTGNAVGIWGQATSSSAVSTGRSYGVFGKAGNASSGYNYGIYGQLYGTNNGAGVFGTVTGDIDVAGKYAGYFYGTTKVDGAFYVGTALVTSDETAKKEVKQLDKNNMAKLKQLNGVSYKYKNPVEMGQYGAETTDTVADPNTLFDAALYEQVHLGLLAQELQAVYPELVKTDPSGLLGIDYMGLIPVLLEAIKEQQAAIDDQQTAIKLLTDEVDKLKTKADR